MTPERPQSPRNTSYWTSGSAVAPSTVRTWSTTGQRLLYISKEVLFIIHFLLSSVLRYEEFSISGIKGKLDHFEANLAKVQSFCRYWTSALFYSIQWYCIPSVFPLLSLNEKARHVGLTLTVGSSFFPLLGYSLSDMPVKAKRSALNYSLPITFNKAGELVNLFRCMYLFDMVEAAKWNAAHIKPAHRKDKCI